jgi:hypothetical protein
MIRFWMEYFNCAPLDILIGGSTAFRNDGLDLHPAQGHDESFGASKKRQPELHEFLETGGQTGPVFPFLGRKIEYRYENANASTLGTPDKHPAKRSALNCAEFGFAARAVGQDISIVERLMRGLSQAADDNSREGEKARATLRGMG